MLKSKYKRFLTGLKNMLATKILKYFSCIIHYIANNKRLYELCEG